MLRASAVCATEELLKKVGLNRDPETFVEDLSISEKQQVEIAKALAAEKSIMTTSRQEISFFIFDILLSSWR